MSKNLEEFKIGTLINVQNQENCCKMETPCNLHDQKEFKSKNVSGQTSCQKNVVSDKHHVGKK